MSVTEAAGRLGVGRPALSNLLNGKASLSQDMALRLEGTFGADREKLLALQAESDQHRRRSEERAVPVGTYVPAFLTITARQIADWAANNVNARQHLPVLLRRLVHATGRELRHVDFPGYDNAQRHGWDGQIDAGAATPWIPAGKSCWEFSVNADPRRKAEHDYQARLRALSAEERGDCTFVFVTPRNWEGKAQWVRRKEDTENWMAVRAYDASDLEQWLETTVAPRIWLAGELGIPTEGFETADRFWDRWAAASAPPMTPAIFAPSVVARAKEFKQWLDGKPGDRPFTVAADSREEAIAFVACLMRHADLPADTADRVVVFHSVAALQTLAQSSSPFIPIVHDEAVEREVTTLCRQRHCIVVRPRNAVDRGPDAVVELLNHTAFEVALRDMGVAPEAFDRLAADSGRSPTVLRRRLSQVDAVRLPPWAADETTARRLIPMTLVGVWHSESNADREVVGTLAGRDYAGVELSVAGLLQLDDCPVWSVDQYQGVVSKIDALFATSRWVTAKNITDFLNLAKYVLSESDPALELPEDERWLAGVYGKVREHSGALRTSICETLVMLSVHGNALFQQRFGIDVENRVAALVRALLTPFTIDKLLSQDRDLPNYAEAAPLEILAMLERDLQQQEPIVRELLKPAGQGAFDQPSRTGILWALERIAWNPQTLMRVVLILADLSRTNIDGNWINKPINSLSAIFLSWLPQTGASIDERIKALEALCQHSPDIGWQVCIQQFEGGHQVGHDSDRPHWRNDATGAGRGVVKREVCTFRRKALDLAISWPAYDESKLGDLVDQLGSIPKPDRLTVWNLIDEWAQETTEESLKAALRERIRLRVLTSPVSDAASEESQRARAREIYDHLAPQDPALRHAWLFASSWIDYSADDFAGEDHDFDKRARQIHEHRARAMTEIWSSRGRDGVRALAVDCHAWTVGQYAAFCIPDRHEVTEFLQSCLSSDVRADGQLDDLMRGFMWQMDEDGRAAVISTLLQFATDEQAARLLVCAPFHEPTWRIVDGQREHVRQHYWSRVFPHPGKFTESEICELVEHLLDAGRPRAAFFAVHLDLKKMETSRLRKLLGALSVPSAEPHGHFRVDTYYLDRALTSLDGRPGVTVDEMAQLEFAFIHALDGRNHGIPNIERRITKSPELFVGILGLVYKRSDEQQDPPDWRVDDTEGLASRQGAAFRVLQQITRIPGTDVAGNVDAVVLRKWVAEARRLCREYGRARVGDTEIGQLLSRARGNEDGSWPCLPVCEVLQATASENIASGFTTGVRNARGVTSRGIGEGGEQERELAARYRALARRRDFDYPYVANILEQIAKNYDQEAHWEDVEVEVATRLEH